jgi:hypothetical protein
MFEADHRGDSDMQLVVRPAAFAAAALLFACGAAHAQERMEVPVTGVTLSDGVQRFTIPVMVGGVKIDAGLDSGSTGLRIMPGVLGSADAAETGAQVKYSYGSGVELSGPLADATVAIGALSKSVKVQSVHTVGCTAGKPSCPASRIDAKDYGVQGDGLKGEGFKAIIGVNMADASAPNPLKAIGARRWIMELPTYGSSKPGRLILNPTDEDMAGFIRFHTDPAFTHAPRASHDAFSACLVNLATKEKVCAPTYLDCGAPGIQAINLKGGPWRPAVQAMLMFMDNGKFATAATFTTDQRRQASHVTFPHEAGVQIPQISAGVTPYYAYAVLYDPDARVVGLKPRTDGSIPAIMPDK